LSTASTFDPSVQAYAVHYEFSAKLDSSKMVAPLTVRYYLADSTYTDVDTTVNLYKYPYHSAEVFVTTSILLGQDNFFDIARTDSFLYFSPLGDYGVYEYRLSTHQTRLLVNFTEGGHTCAESSSVFFEVERDGIYRYDLLSNTYSQLLQATFPGIVTGLDVFNGNLYVNFAISISPLRVFTFDGTLVDSIAYHPEGRFLAINDSIVYSVVNPSQFGGRFELSRFDLRTRAFRSHVLSPAKWPGGIKTYANQLYYVDYNKRFVGVVPVSDLTLAQ
jgi:hypothetical protein